MNLKMGQQVRVDVEDGTPIYIIRNADGILYRIEGTVNNDVYYTIRADVYHTCHTWRVYNGRYALGANNEYSTLEEAHKALMKTALFHSRLAVQTQDTYNNNRIQWEKQRQLADHEEDALEISGATPV